MRSFFGAVVAALLAGCTSPAPPHDGRSNEAAAQHAAPAPPPAITPPDSAPAPAPTVLAAGGFGTIVVGKRPGEAVGFALRDDGSYDDLCRIYVTAAQPGLYALVEDGIVRRVTVHGKDGAGIATARGVRVGSSEAEVRAAYVPVGTELHKYSGPPAKNLYFGEEGVPEALRFEIGTDGRVEAIHAGASPQLRYVEGCS